MKTQIADAVMATDELCCYDRPPLFLPYGIQQQAESGLHEHKDAMETAMRSSSKGQG